MGETQSSSKCHINASFNPKTQESRWWRCYFAASPRKNPNNKRMASLVENWSFEMAELSPVTLDRKYLGWCKEVLWEMSSHSDRFKELQVRVNKLSQFIVSSHRLQGRVNAEVESKLDCCRLYLLCVLFFCFFVMCSFLPVELNVPKWCILVSFLHQNSSILTGILHPWRLSTKISCSSVRFWIL